MVGESPPQDLLCADSSFRNSAEIHGMAAVIAGIGDHASPSLLCRHHELCRQSLINERAVIGLFAQAGIPLILLRGLEVSVRLYGGPFLRNRSDIDLLVPPGHRRQAVALLLENGFVPDYGICEEDLDRLARFRGSHLFISLDGRSAVDLHWRAAEQPWRFYSRETDLWKRSREFHFDGVDCRVLGPDDLFLHLCLHATQHAWDRMVLLADVALSLFRRAVSPDCSAVSRRVVAQRIRRPVLVALNLARWLAAPTPLPVPWEQFAEQGSPAVTGTVKRIIRQWEGFHLSRRERWYTQLACLGSIRRILRWVCWLVLTPTVLEIRRWKLPGCLCPLYLPLRQYRLVSKQLHSAAYAIGRQARRRPPPAVRTALVESLLKEGLAVRMAAEGNSMRPTYGSPSEVVIRPLGVEGIKPGETVLYRNASGDLRLHRVMRIDKDAGVVSLKGDASPDQVERVPLEDVLGTVAEPPPTLSQIPPHRPLRNTRSDHRTPHEGTEC